MQNFYTHGKYSWERLILCILSIRTYRRSKVVSNLVCQSQLRHLRWHPTVIIHKSNDASVERPFRRLVHAADGLRVSLVLLANAARRSGRRRHPGQPERAAREVAVSEHVGETEVLVVAQRVDVEEVADVDVLHAELVDLAVQVGAFARRVVVNLKG